MRNITLVGEIGLDGDDGVLHHQTDADSDEDLEANESTRRRADGDGPDCRNQSRESLGVFHQLGA